VAPEDKKIPAFAGVFYGGYLIFAILNLSVIILFALGG
jgi:hypothetical protein